MRIKDSIKVVTLVFAAFIVFPAGDLRGGETLTPMARAEETQIAEDAQTTPPPPAALSDKNAWNKKIIEEFRANAGKVGGRFANVTLLLLDTTGAKSGLPRNNPLAYIADGERLVVIASSGGAPNNPDWYYNLVAHPEVSVEVGSERFQAQATVATEPERTQLFEQMVAVSPIFAEYQQKAAPRIIPVIILIRKS